MNRRDEGMLESPDGLANTGPDTALERGIIALAVTYDVLFKHLLGPKLYGEIKLGLHDALHP